MNILKHFDKENLHHAYLVEGARNEVAPEIIKFIESIGIETLGNPDFCEMQFDVLKIDDARDLKTLASEKSYDTQKKIFLISANNFLLEAQNTLLKIFEEPIEDTHFFIILPDTSILLKTLLSRFYLIKTKNELNTQVAEKFIKSPLKERLDFIKELLTEEGEDEKEKNESPRSKAMKFLNALETVLHTSVQSSTLNTCEHIMKVRGYINQPGSATKTLMESVAIIVPTR